jgi:hypothetical protein
LFSFESDSVRERRGHLLNLLTPQLERSRNTIIAKSYAAAFSKVRKNLFGDSHA